MRIIAGRHRGRRLVAPKGDAIRPTTDRVRESLFSIIGNLHGFVVVDGYAGTGALGCEALSRGAAFAFFFDNAPSSIDLVRENLETLGELDKARILACGFEAALEEVDVDIDVVFLDPPYGSNQPAVALTCLGNCVHVTERTLIVLEQDVSDVLPETRDLEVTDTRVYGDTRLTFWSRRAEDAPA